MKKRFRIIITSLFFLFAASTVFALEEYVSDVYKQIDHAFSNKSESELNAILSKNQKDKYYYLMENYTQKKIRRLLIKEEYEFALEATVIVIENNLDNEQAVEMYAAISESYETQKSFEKEQEQKRQYEIAKLEKEKEDKREKVNKEYVSSKKADSDKTVYVSGKETKLTSYRWKAALGLADLGFITEAKNSLSILNYGISLDINYEYSLSTITAGLDLYGAFRFLSLSDSDSMLPLVADIEFAPKFALPAVSKNLFLRAGIGLLKAGKSDTAPLTETITGTFVTPLIGIEYERLMLGPLQIDVGVDWLAGHLLYDDVNFAMGGKINFAFIFAEMEKVKLTFNVGLRDKILLKESGIENRANAIIAIGVENVIR